MVSRKVSTLVNFLSFPSRKRMNKRDGVLDDGRDLSVQGNQRLLKSQADHKRIAFQNEGIELQGFGQLNNQLAGKALP
jgi:hypothetical protein